MKRTKTKGKGALLTAIMFSLLLPTCVGHAATQVSFTDGINSIGDGEVLIATNPYLLNGTTDSDGVNYTFAEDSTITATNPIVASDGNKNLNIKVNSDKTLALETAEVGISSFGDNSINLDGNIDISAKNGEPALIGLLVQDGGTIESINSNLNIDLINSGATADYNRIGICAGIVDEDSGWINGSSGNIKLLGTVNIQGVTVGIRTTQDPTKVTLGDNATIKAETISTSNPVYNPNYDTGCDGIFSEAGTIVIGDNLTLTATGKSSDAIRCGGGTITIGNGAQIVGDGNGIKTSNTNAGINIGNNSTINSNGEYGIESRSGIITVGDNATITSAKTAIIAGTQYVGLPDDDDNHKVIIGENANVTGSLYGLQSIVNGSLTVKSGTISVVGEDCFAIAGFGGEVNVGYDGSSFSSQDVKITGDIKIERAGKVNLALETADSIWDGSIYVDTAYDEDYDTDTEFNLWLKNGATWQNEEKGNLFNDFSDVSHFVGGESFENAGIIKQNLNSRPLKFKNYQGYSIISYPDLQSESLANNGVTIEEVDSSTSGIALVAEAGTGGDISTETTTKATFNKLANQLSVLEGQDNLEKEVSIKGLTTSTLKVTDEGLEFKDNVLQVKDDYQILGNDEELNLYETETMKTFDSILGSSVLNLRKSISTVIPKHQVEDGIWTRVIRNKLNYSKGATNFSSQTTGIQVGYENFVHKDWSIGAGFGYASGSESFRNLGSGDSKEVDLFLYSNWKNSDDSFLDLTLGHYRFDNEYDFTTDLGYNLIGDYDNKALAINARVGKVFKHKDNYLTPQIEVSLGHIKESNQKAQRKDTNENVLDIKQDSMNLVVGKIGFEVGKKSEKYDAYFKAMYAKDFSDDLETTYTALYEDSKKVTKSYNDSWLELELGLCKKISQNSYYNINFEKIIGGDFGSSWQVNTGVNWSF